MYFSEEDTIFLVAVNGFFLCLCLVLCMPIYALHLQLQLKEYLHISSNFRMKAYILSKCLSAERWLCNSLFSIVFMPALLLSLLLNLGKFSSDVDLASGHKTFLRIDQFSGD